MELPQLSHVNPAGEAEMVDVGPKRPVRRSAEASGLVRLLPGVIQLVRENALKKGDVLAAARIAGIQGAKRTAELIPLCHNIPIDKIQIDFDIRDDHILIRSRAACEAKTGIEMEALAAVSIAALTIYDMCKAVDKSITITDIKLETKHKHEPTIP